MVNIGLLKDAIKNSGKSIKYIAKCIGIDQSTFYRRLADKGLSFTIGEVSALVEVLSLTSEQARSIFFISNVAFMRRGKRSVCDEIIQPKSKRKVCITAKEDF